MTLLSILGVSVVFLIFTALYTPTIYGQENSTDFYLEAKLVVMSLLVYLL
jgi:hypothetical protein